MEVGHLRSLKATEREGASLEQRGVPPIESYLATHQGTSLFWNVHDTIIEVAALPQSTDCPAPPPLCPACKLSYLTEAIDEGTEGLEEAASTTTPARSASPAAAITAEELVKELVKLF